MWLAGWSPGRHARSTPAWWAIQPGRCMAGRCRWRGRRCTSVGMLRSAQHLNHTTNHLILPAAALLLSDVGVRRSRAEPAQLVHCQGQPRAQAGERPSRCPPPPPAQYLWPGAGPWCLWRLAVRIARGAAATPCSHALPHALSCCRVLQPLKLPLAVTWPIIAPRGLPSDFYGGSSPLAYAIAYGQWCTCVWRGLGTGGEGQGKARNMCAVGQSSEWLARLPSAPAAPLQASSACSPPWPWHG